jgi:hypothetical protein
MRRSFVVGSRPLSRIAMLVASLCAAGCAGTDGVPIGGAPDAAASPAPASTSALPALPPPPESDEIDAGAANFDVPVAPPTSIADAGVLPTPLPTFPDAAPPPVDLLEAARVECVDVVNAYRAAVSVPALARWVGAEACVDAEAHYDAYYQRPHAAFRQCTEATQNECPNWPGQTPAQAVASCLQAMWNEGPTGGNFRNMLSTRWSHVSCGFYPSASGRWWLVQNYR